MCLSSVLNEEGVTFDIESDILSQSKVVDTVDGASSVVRLLDGVSFDVGIVNDTYKMEMDGISS